MTKNKIEENAIIDRLVSTIPGGAHVHTKSYDSYPVTAPKITSHGKGAYLFDQNGNKFLDYGMALRSVTIGYGEKSINEAAIKQINNGNTSSFPTLIELEAAERLVSLIDSADMAKFIKDGSSATTAAVKLARAYTGRKIVARCKEQPFFSYDDWFIGTTSNNAGCLDETVNYTKLFEYNNIQSLEKIISQYSNQVACVILEPATYLMEPTNDFLSKVRLLCDKKNIVLIFDEIITGFRWSIKGAQHYYNVEPDLTAFGKGMANGFSLSALVGKKELMDLGSIGVENRVFLLSSTHGAEMCSLGAFVATMDFYEKNDVVSHLKEYGSKLIHMMNEVSSYHDLADFFIVDGLPWLPRYTTNNLDGQRDSDLTMLFQQEMARHKVLMRNIIICYRHGERELELTRDALDKSLVVYKKALDNGVSRYLEKI